MGRTAVIVGRLARFMLLCCTALGVSAMHTMGHEGPGHLAAGHHAAPAHAAPVDAMPDCADPCVTARESPAEPGGDWAFWSVCLAVLAAVGLAALLALALRGARSRPSALRWISRVGPPTGRGPPRSAHGLRLAAVSVMRV
ncbi:hypothetical protein GCM10009682_26680 [Luedemannella flava]|uniref:Uncharacterized protein n=1 Tax=Luedemannella flava TaxID=349316 RepID=A0ABN2LZL2_9ACTN